MFVLGGLKGVARGGLLGLAMSGLYALYNNWDHLKGTAPIHYWRGPWDQTMDIFTLSLSLSPLFHVLLKRAREWPKFLDPWTSIFIMCFTENVYGVWYMDNQKEHSAKSNVVNLYDIHLYV